MRVKRIVLPPVLGLQRSSHVRWILKKTTMLEVRRAVMELCASCREAQNEGT